MLETGSKERIDRRTAVTTASGLVPDVIKARPRRRGGKRAPEQEAAFGARIRAARVAAQMSQGALGDAIGVSFQQVQKYELGKDRVAASTLQAIAAALSTHPGSFYGDETREPPRSVPEVRAMMDLGSRIQRIRNPELVKRLMALVDLLVLAEEGD